MQYYHIICKNKISKHINTDPICKLMCKNEICHMLSTPTHEAKFSNLLRYFLKFGFPPK